MSHLNQKYAEKKALEEKAGAAKKLVLEKEPSAFVDDDGEWVRIGFKRVRTSNCHECKQSWTREEVAIGQALGAGGSEDYAWISAARSLKLMD